MKVVIIDYGSGNLHSTTKAFEQIAKKTKHSVVLSGDAVELENASHIVLPGVGAFADCMKGLSSISGMIKTLEKRVLKEKIPFLGICVGMQLMADIGFEHNKTKGLGWIKGDVRAIKPSDNTLKIPHMGWNELEIKKEHPLFNGIKNGDHAYFVHSYHMICTNEADVLAQTEYGGKVTAAIAHDNLMGTQFHPEKSQKVGLTIIDNFLRIRASSN